MSARTVISDPSWTNAAPAPSPKPSQRRPLNHLVKLARARPKNVSFEQTLMPDLPTRWPPPITGEFIEYFDAIRSAHSAIGVFDQRCRRVICCIAVTALKSHLETFTRPARSAFWRGKNSGGASMAPPLMLIMSPSSDLARAIELSLTSCRPEAFRLAFHRPRQRPFPRASPPPCTRSSAAGSPPTTRSAARCERPWSGR